MKYVSCKWVWSALTLVVKISLCGFNGGGGALFLVLAPFTGWAAAPDNDLCSDAEIIPSDTFPTNASSPYFTAFIPDVTAATTMGEPPLPNCINVGATNSVWYKFSPATGAAYTFSVGTDSGTTARDTALAIFESPSGDCSGATNLVACNEDEASLQAAVRATLVANRTYFIVVWVGSVGLDGENRAVRMRVSVATVPFNDICAGSLEIPGTVLPHLTPLVDTTLASTNGDPPLPTCTASRGLRSVWYHFTPPATNAYVISTRHDPNTTVLDTLIGVYSSANGCSGPFALLACDDSGAGRAAVAARLHAGTTYYIVVWEGGNEEVTLGETTLQLLVQTAPQPEAITLAATNITSTSALLTAQVHPKGLPSAVWFQWGETTNYGFTTSARTLGSGTNPVVGTRLIGNYVPNVIYHFRAIATNAGGFAFGADRTFSFSTITEISGPMLQPNGSFAGAFIGSPGQVYQVLGSTNLITWEVIGQATSVGDHLFQFTDPGAVSHSRRFYQILSP